MAPATSACQETYDDLTVFVTQEPAGGSVVPTRAPVIVASLA